MKDLPPRKLRQCPVCGGKNTCLETGKYREYGGLIRCEAIGA